MFLQIYYFVLLGGVMLTVTDGQHIYTNTRVVEGNEGTQIVLHCDYDGTDQIPITWKKKQSQTKSVRILQYLQTSTERSWDETEYGILGKASLVIKKLSYDRDQGIFVCHRLRDWEITVNVLVPPKGLGFEGIPRKNYIVYENVPTDITCKVDSANPPPHFSWTFEDNIVTYKSVKMRDKLKSQINFIPERSLNNKKLLCLVKTSSGITHTAYLVLTVYYGPDLTITKSPKRNLIEGRHLLLLCNAVANPRITKFRWQYKSHDSYWEDKSETRISYAIDEVQRTDAGSYRCLAQNSWDKRWVKSRAANVEVNYQPSVRIKRQDRSDSVELTCDADGSPSVYTFSDWQHKVYGDVIRELPGRKMNGYRHILTLHNVSYQDTGSYVCKVSNGIGPSQSKEILLMPEGVPVFEEGDRKQYQVQENNDIRISAKFYAFPKYRSVTWTTPNGERIANRVGMEMGNVFLNMRGTHTWLHGQQVNLDLKNVGLGTAGNYTLMVENRKGVSSFVLEVVLVKPMMAVTPKVHESSEFPFAIVGGVIGIVIVAAVIIAIILYMRYRAKHNYKPRNNSPDSADASLPLNNAEEQPYVNVQGSRKTNNNKPPSSQLIYADLEFNKNSKTKVKPKPGYEPPQYAMIDLKDGDKMTD